MPFLKRFEASARVSCRLSARLSIARWRAPDFSFFCHISSRSLCLPDQLSVRRIHCRGGKEILASMQATYTCLGFEFQTEINNVSFSSPCFHGESNLCLPVSNRIKV